ncbi:hypothetical protein [Gilvimarinus algae]|uniref:Surface antigen domain-containing protein n=1 Tax=Gilvimarinus algae TaxID=3058037 RepID=A0ABT8TCJ8_9GAMM|nr:hypothetical protein [Gilvimarinus sp. SDUM040014]MDO3381098.1 hypothetical protein [Gilvimarinus sp. SDUM040014]
MFYRNPLLLCSALLYVSTAQAANLQFMGRSVASEMTETEVASFKTTIGSALNDAPDQQTIHWQSPDSPLQGRIKVKYSYENSGTECRKAILDLRNDEQRRDFFHVDVCNNAGKWQVTETAASQFSKDDWTSLGEAFAKAADSLPNDQTAEWERSGHQARITPLSSPVDDSHCRLMSIELTDSKDAHAQGVYTFCKEQGQWRRKAR